MGMLYGGSTESTGRLRGHGTLTLQQSEIVPKLPYLPLSLLIVFLRSSRPTMQLHAILPPMTKADAIQVLAIKRITGSYTLLLSAFSRTGTVIREPTPIKNTALESLESLLLFEPLPGTVENRAVYLDMKGDIKSLFFFRDGHQDPIQTAYKGQNKYVRLLQVGLQHKGIFVGQRADGTSTILQVGSDGSVKALHEYRDAVDAGLYSGFVDREGITHVSRYSISPVLGVSSFVIVNGFECT